MISLANQIAVESPLVSTVGDRRDRISGSGSTLQRQWRAENDHQRQRRNHGRGLRRRTGDRAMLGIRDGDWGLAIGLALRIVVVCRTPAFAQAPVTYHLSFPEAEHHRMQVEVTFPDVPPGTLRVLMSRTSPGRYAIHEFAKNVYDVQIDNGAGAPLSVRAAGPERVGRERSRRRRACSLQGVWRPDRRHISWNRSDPRAHQHSGGADVGARAGRAAGPRHVRRRCAAGRWRRSSSRRPIPGPSPLRTCTT